MTNTVNEYKKIYKLNNLNCKYISENSLSFIFYFNNEYYLLDDNNFVVYSAFLPLKITDLIYNIEKLYSLKIYNFFPVCFCNNSMVIACKLKSKPTKLVKINKKNFKEIVDLIEKEKSFYSEEYDDELLLIEKYGCRYRFYQNFIKKFIITEKKRRKKEYLKLIKKLMGDAKSVIDVSCGDNDDIFKLSENLDTVVGNDINLYLVRKEQSKYKNILFTNDNILNLKVKSNYFDVSYCKNTLHHLNSKKEIITTLNNLFRVSKKIILVDIEDPKVTGGVPKLLNKYLYMRYLKDAGKKFIDFRKFKEIVDSNFDNTCNISYLTFENILGKYMIAVIEKR